MEKDDMSIQALREQRSAKAKALNELVTKTEWNAAVDQPVYDVLLAEIDDIDARIARITASNQRLADQALNEQVADASARAGRDQASPSAALWAKWLRGGDKALTAEDWATVRATMSTGTNTEGGFTVQTDVATTVLDALKAFGGMRAVSQVIQTTAGNPMQWPTSDGTAEEGEIVAENATATDADVSFGTKSLPVYKYSSKVVAVPIELLMDSNVDIESFIRARLVTRLGRSTNKHFTIGTGSSQPFGVVPAAQVGLTAANSTSQVTAVTYASLVDLQHSVDPAYRQGGNCRWMFHDNTLRSLRKVLDTTGRPIFVAGYENGPPGASVDRLLDSPVQINQDMATMAAGARSILYGDFSHYVIRDVLAVDMLRFTDSAYAKKGQVGFLAFMRSGGNLVDVGGAVKVFINAAS
jgi:HK97 family phage major capsid protein